MVRAILANTVYYLWITFRILILVRIIFSFVRPAYGSFLYRLADVAERATEPLLTPIRRLMPPTAGLDFSPMIALILLQFLGSLLLQFIARMPAL